MTRSKSAELTRRLDAVESHLRTLQEGERQRRLRDEPRCPQCGVEWNYHRDQCQSNPISGSQPQNERPTA